MNETKLVSKSINKKKNADLPFNLELRKSVALQRTQLKNLRPAGHGESSIEALDLEFEIEIGATTHNAQHKDKDLKKGVTHTVFNQEQEKKYLCYEMVTDIFSFK